MTSTAISASTDLSELLAQRQRQGALDDPLVLEVAGPGLWRLCDTRVPEDPGHLLALIEAKTNELQAPFRDDQVVWSIFPTRAMTTIG